MPKIINQLQQVKENPIIAKLIAKYRLNDDVLDYFENKKQLLAFCSSYYSCEDPDKQQKPCQRSINTTLRYIPETKKFQLASVRCWHARNTLSYKFLSNPVQKQYYFLLFGDLQEEFRMIQLKWNFNVSPTWNQNNNNFRKKAWQEYAKKNFKNKGFFCTDKTGTGKTFFMFALANWFVTNTKWKVILINSNYFINTIFKNIHNHHDYKNDRLIDALMWCDLLFIDDFGSEHLSPWVRDDIWYKIFNNRLHGKNKKTFINSNFNFEELTELYLNIKEKSSQKIKKIKANRLIRRIKDLTKVIT